MTTSAARITSATDRTKAWEHGFVLWRALSAFGNEPEWKALNEGWALDTWNSPLELAQNGEEIFERLRPLAEKLTKHSELRSRIEKRTAKWLAQGQLLGIGYAVPRQPTDSPKWINRDVWTSAKIKWSESSVAGAGLSFVSVRVLHPTWLDRIVSNTAPEAQPATGKRRQGRGRKSSEQYILDAVSELMNKGQLDPGAPHKQNTALIRERILQLAPGEFPGGKGLRDETIRKVLVPALKRHVAGSAGSRNQ